MATSEPPAGVVALVDLDRLSAYLRASGWDDDLVVDSVLAGGTQNVMLRLRIGDRDAVFRRPPLNPRPRSNDALRREIRVLRALVGTPVPVPELLLGCDDESALGYVFYLTEFVSGFNPTTALPAHVDVDRVAAASGPAGLRALATLEGVDHRRVGLDDFGRVDGFLERQVPRWLGELASYGDLAGYTVGTDVAEAERLGSWLDEHRPPLGAVGLSHGDYHLGNLLMSDQDVASIVDWEMSTLAPTVLDAARFIAGWPSERHRMQVHGGVWESASLSSTDDLCQTYLTAHPAVSEDELRWYVVLACFKLGIILEGTHARAVSGRVSRDLGEHMHRAAVDLIDRGVLAARTGLRDL